MNIIWYIILLYIVLRASVNYSRAGLNGKNRFSRNLSRRVVLYKWIRIICSCLRIHMNNVGFCRRSTVDVNQSCFVVAPGDVALGPQPYATRIHYIILPHNSHCKHSSINDMIFYAAAAAVTLSSCSGLFKSVDFYSSLFRFFL